jgi:predicted RNA-binding Zn-ribbon protein involved in translation (DUF1610 family)
MSVKNDSDAPIRAEAMKYTTGERQTIPMHQVKRVRALIQKECCNFSSGNCVFLDDGIEHGCPQISAEKVLCEWFRDAILPLDVELQTEIFNRCSKSVSDTLKHCTVCGKPLAANSKAKYCPKCALKIHRKQKTESQRKKRISVDN